MKKYFLRIIVIFIFIINIIPFYGCNTPTQNKTIGLTQNAIAEFSIFSYNGKDESNYGLKNYGHSFLSFTNISNQPIIVGKYSLDMGQSVSIGTWSINSHFGIWYNVEANYIKFYNKYDGRISITKQINADDLININEYILNNDTWNPLKNCSCFSINVWNTVAKESEIIKKPLLYNPSYLAKQINMFDNVQINKEIPSLDIFGYYKNDFMIYSFKENFYE